MMIKLFKIIVINSVLPLLISISGCSTSEVIITRDYSIGSAPGKKISSGRKFGFAASARTISLQWDPNSETDLAGYKVYYKANSAVEPFDGTGMAQGPSPIDVNNTTNILLSGFDSNNSYSFTVTAYNSSGIESSFSNVITVAESAAPTVYLTAPASSTIVSGTVSVTAEASDNTGVTKVEFYVNDVLANSETTTPYIFSWNTAPLSTGSYSIFAKGYDTAGNVGQSDTVTVNVLKDTSPPTISFTNPANGSTVSGAVNVSVDVIDNISIKRVDFFVNGTIAASLNTPPYSYNLNTASYADGVATLSAKAYDSSDNSGQASISLAVKNTIPTPEIALATTPTPATTTAPVQEPVLVTTPVTNTAVTTANYSIADVLVVLQISVGKITPTKEQITKYDVAPLINGKSAPNGIINTGDAIVLLSRILIN